MTDRFTVAPGMGTYVARAGGAVIAETNEALVIAEPGSDPVAYFPRDDAGMAFLEPSPTRTSCPHRGEASHYHLMVMEGRIDDAAWSYENPQPRAAAIAGYVAFHPEKVTIETM